MHVTGYEKRNLIASALRMLAKEQKMYVRVRLSELPENLLEDRSQCSTEELPSGLKALGVVFVNDLIGTVRFDPEILLEMVNSVDASSLPNA